MYVSNSPGLAVAFHPQTDSNSDTHFTRHYTNERFMERQLPTLVVIFVRVHKMYQNTLAAWALRARVANYNPGDYLPSFH